MVLSCGLGLNHDVCKYKHEYALICTVSCYCSCLSQWVSVMRLPPSAPSLIPNDDLVARSPPRHEASLPLTPLCLPFHFPACLISSQILGHQSLKASLGLEVLTFCTYFSGRRVNWEGRGASGCPGLLKRALQWQRSLLGSQSCLTKLTCWASGLTGVSRI